MTDANTKEQAETYSPTDSASNPSEQATSPQAANEFNELRKCIYKTSQDEWYIFKFQQGPALAFRNNQDEQLGSGGFGTVYRAYQANWDDAHKRYQIDRAVTKAVAKVAHEVLDQDEYKRVTRLTQYHQMTSDVLELPSRNNQYVTLTEYLGPNNLYDCQFTGLLNQLEIIIQVNQRLVDMHYPPSDSNRPATDSNRPATVHADLKPDNVVYNEQTGRVAITDFDLACTLAKDAERSYVPALRDIPVYSPPELGKPDPYCQTYLERRSDVYSLTSVIVQVLGVDYTQSERLRKFPIDQIDLGNWDDQDFSLDAYLKQFLNTMQNQSPSQRPTSKQVQYFFDNAYYYCQIKDQETKAQLTEQQQQDKQQYKARMIGVSSKLAESFVSQGDNVFETLLNQLKEEQESLKKTKISFLYSLFSTSLQHRLLAINDFIGLTKKALTSEELTAKEDKPYGKQVKGYSQLLQKDAENSPPKSKSILDNAYKALTREDDRIADIVSELSKAYNLFASAEHMINLDGEQPSKTYSA